MLPRRRQRLEFGRWTWKVIPVTFDQTLSNSPAQDRELGRKSFDFRTLSKKRKNKKQNKKETFLFSKKFFAIPHSENFPTKKNKVSFLKKREINKKDFSDVTLQLTGHDLLFSSTRCQCQTRIFLFSRRRIFVFDFFLNCRFFCTWQPSSRCFLRNLSTYKYFWPSSSHFD